MRQLGIRQENGRTKPPRVNRKRAVASTNITRRHAPHLHQSALHRGLGVAEPAIAHGRLALGSRDDRSELHRSDQQHAFTRRRPRSYRKYDLVSPRLLLRRDQPRTMPCPAGLGAARPVKRRNAVTLTAMAPTTETIICQVADGITM